MKRTVFVTGASSGIGRAIALHCARNGTHLILSARREDRLQDVARECQQSGATSSILPVDLAQNFPLELFSELVPQDQPFHAVHSAGVASFGPAQEITPAQVDAQLQLNLRTPMILNSALLPKMIAYGAGTIVHISSIAAVHAFPGASVYAASKAGLKAYGASLRCDVRHLGIRVIDVLPGATNTEIWGESSPPVEDMMTADEAGSVIASLLDLPPSVTIDEVTLMPRKGIL